MPDLPTGTVTLLFTDIERSTQLLQRLGPRYGDVLAEYRALLRASFQQHDGHEVDTQGDSFFVAFARALDAVAAAVAIQRALATSGGHSPWPEDVTIPTRMGLHTGEPRSSGAGYVGLDVHRAARIGAAGHGGQVLLSQATWSIIADDLPDGVSGRDLGLHRLKDLRRPKHLFQLVIADLPNEFPPLKTLESRPNNLPLQLTSFVGRSQELAVVRQRLLDRQVHLLTLTGAGGTGKTRLALQVAADLLDDFADGVFFVDLAPISDPELVVASIATLFDVRGANGQQLSERLKLVLHDKHLLLLLDNFEQVTAAAPVMSALLPAVPGLKLLVTSREALQLYGEQEFPVLPLALPDPAQPATVAALIRSPAVELFLQRTQAVKPDFQLNNENAPAIASICQRLDGLPLAIELAAARVKMFPPKALLGRLDQRLKTLTGGARDLPARQRTLRNTIEWSYHLLDADEQRLFARLGVFVGGCTLEAVSAVCNADHDLASDSVDGLLSLVNKSLVRQVDTGGDARFTMLGTLREYAVEQLLALGELPARRNTHARHYLAWAMAGLEAREITSQEWSAEQDNLLAAQQWALEQDDLVLVVRLQGFVWQSWWRYGRWSKLHRLPPGILASLLTQRDRLLPLLQLQDLTSLGQELWLQGNYAAAEVFFAEALARCRRGDSPGELAEVLRGLADVKRDQAAYERAEGLYQESLALFQHQGDMQGSAWIYHAWGELELLSGNIQRALALAQTSLSLFREAEVPHGIAAARMNVGFGAQLQGDEALAITSLTESLLFWQSTGNVIFVMACLIGFAAVAGSRTDPDCVVAGAQRAARLLGAVAALAEAFDAAVSHFHFHRTEYDRAKARIQTQLDGAMFAAAWAEGRALTLEQAIAYALEATG